MAQGSYEGQGRTFNRGSRDVVEPVVNVPATEVETVTVHMPGGPVEMPKEIYDAIMNSQDVRINAQNR